MKKIMLCVAMVAMLAACSKGEGEDGFILSPMSDPDDVCSAMDDAYFMQYCYQKFDINGDAKVSKAEAAVVTSITLVTGNNMTHVTSIRGIEYFTNLEDFDGQNTSIEVADLRANTKLQKVDFSYCGDLVEVRLPNSVTSLGYAAFSGCSSLTRITIPEGVTSIGSSAFFDCSSLTSITIPASVTSIGDTAFCYCSSLTSITIPNSVTLIGGDAFSDCSSLTSITIPASVTSLGYAAFSGCSSLAKFAGKFASNDGRCLIMDGRLVGFAPAGLTAYTIPEGVTSIGGRAFSHSSLTSITIPASVTSIGYEAFYDCGRLADVYCKPTTPPQGDEWMFSVNASGRKIYVPRASVDAYRNAEYWRDYAGYIVGGYDF